MLDHFYFLEHLITFFNIQIKIHVKLSTCSLSLPISPGSILFAVSGEQQLFARGRWQDQSELSGYRVPDRSQLAEDHVHGAGQK